MVDDREIADGPRHLDVVRALHHFQDRDRALVQRFRLDVLSLLLDDDGEIVEDLGGEGIAARQRLADDRKRAPHQRLGLGEPALIDVHVRHEVERARYLHVVRVLLLFTPRQGRV